MLDIVMCIKYFIEMRNINTQIINFIILEAKQTQFI